MVPTSTPQTSTSCERPWRWRVLRADCRMTAWKRGSRWPLVMVVGRAREGNSAGLSWETSLVVSVVLELVWAMREVVGGAHPTRCHGFGGLAIRRSRGLLRWWRVGREVLELFRHRS